MHNFIQNMPCINAMMEPKSSPAKICYLNFHPLEAVSSYSDQQLQVSENYIYLIANVDVEIHMYLIC